MANDYFLPHQDMIDLVPQKLRNPMVKSLLDNLFNRFLTQDEAVPLFGYVGRKPTSPDDRTPKVPQLNVERDINALIPILSFKVGTDTYSFTAQDLVRKAQVLGISDDQSSWLYSQGNNYAPPIDFDKFTNFFNYYWVAQALPTTPELTWNPSLAPEYYVIAQPKLTDADKPNVRVATTAAVVPTGSGYYQQTWTVTCTAVSPTFINFSIQANGPLVGFAPGEQTQTFQIPVLASVANPGPYPTITNNATFNVASAAEPLLSFNVVRDVILDNGGGPYAYESFAVGDVFTISAPFLTSTYSVTFTGGPGQKGKIAQVDSLDVYQTIDGIMLEEDDRVLMHHGSAADQGIYIVKPGNWVRAPDFDTTNAAPSARVFVREGTLQANRLYESFSAPGGFGWNLAGTNTISNTNNWQEGNFWAKREDLVAIGADLAKVIQATRPIIEFAANLQLNTRVDADGKPTDVGGTLYEQRKTEFNQAPLYDLYRYDGTHAAKVTPIFFYVEDPTADIDPALQRRVKKSTNESSDFMFNHGLLEGQNSLLFYKDKAGELHTIWHPGYSQATVVDQEFGGTGNGVLTVTPGTDAFSAQQIWTLTAVTPTSFEVVGSKLKVLPAPFNVITVGVPYSNGLFDATIVAGSTPFAVGDVFRFRIGNFETTRYVYRDENEALYDLFGGPTLDTQSVGAWQVPRMFFNNVAADNGDEVPEGTLYSHFRGILANQLSQRQDDAFGGSIKLWSEQQNLLAALLMQRDMTPISMIDLAQRQYEASLNAISDIYMTNILEYFSTVEVLSSPADTTELLDWILAIRAKDNDVRTVLYDSTSPVKGFPATLPQLGVTPLAVPGLVFDPELGAELFRHHDGHLTPQFFQNPSFRDRLLTSKLNMKRSDGNITPVVGSYTTSPPSQPYKGELWVYPTGTDNEFRVFDVVSDTSASPPAAGLEVGDYWYNRNSNSLSVWDGTLWQTESNLLAPWITINLADLLNDLLLEVEQRLYDGISAQHRTYFNDNDVKLALYGVLAQQMQRELANWAAANGFDPMAPDYRSTDAFSWNYRSSPVGSFAPINQSVVPARWYNALQSHHLTFGALVVPTSRPNLEPWKLLGNTTKPAGWDSLYAASVTPNMVDAGGYVVGGAVNAVMFSDTALTTPLNGLPLVDGVLLNAGQVILLVSESSPANNGPWVVSSGAWTRASVPLFANTLFVSGGGVERSSTIWVLMNTVSTLNVDPVTVEQVRLWKSQMWLDIQAARPTLKLSVDTNRDELLPPYVSPTLPWSVHALTIQLPPSPEDSYVFGEGSPVETVWTKSIEHRYSMARALFRYDPLSFLGNCWGFEWVEVDDILYDGYDMAVPGHQRFRLHGQPNVQHVRKVPFTISLATAPTNFTLTFVRDAYTSTRAQAWTVRDQTGTWLGTVNEGVTVSLSSAGYVLSNLRIEDEGLPFRIGDKFTLSANADGSGLSVIFEAAPYHQILGFGQTFTHALREASIDTNRSYAMEAYRGWDVNIGYRAGGLVSTDDLRVFTDSASLPDSAFTLRFKRSQYARDLWLQGLRITVVQIGGSVLNSTGQSVPSTDASDWKFRVEGYNPRYLGIEYYELDPAGDFLTLFALSGAHTTREWRQFSRITSVVNTQLPIIITGLQSLTTLLFGYSRKLEDDGWRFSDENGSNIDEETGRVRNWQLEIEKLIDRVYAGIDLGQGHIVNPFIDRVWLSQETGLLSQYYDTALFDVTAHPAVFDTLGVKMNTADLTILRQRGSSMISANIPMFCVHAQVDEYEHLFVLNNLASPSTNDGVIYDPFSGARISTLKLNGRRQGNGTLRPEFGGHYLVGDEVRRNLKASTDKVANYYNADTVFEDELSTRHALALLGFSPKEYMSDLDLNDRTQFNFWRGLVQMKGTNASISAFLNNDRFEDAKLDEYWAYKVAEYGDSRSKVFPELKLTVDDTLQQFTKLMFDQVPAGQYVAFTEINSDDESRWFTLDDLSDDPVSFEAQVVGTYSTSSAIVGTPITLPFVADTLVISGATQVNSTTLLPTSTTVSVIGYGPATPKFNPVKLFNYVDAQLVEEIPHWHPAVGQHAPVALESVNIISNNDPARYNISTLVDGNSNYDPLRMWGAKEVGRVWWDTTNLDYLPYADTTIFPTVDERLSRWGTLADYATVDVVEWVESTVAPSDYDAQAAIDAGDADLDARTRAEGTVYGAKTYSRDRIWSVRPIAWSRAGVALEAAHPSFNGSFNSNLTFENDGTVLLETGTFEQLGVVANMRLGAWQQDQSATRPLSEYIVLDFTKQLSGASNTGSAGAFGGEVTLSVLQHTDKVGQLLMTRSVTASQLRDADGLLVNEWDVATFLTVTELVGGDQEIIQIRNDRGLVNSAPFYGATFQAVAGQLFEFDVPLFGLRIAVVASATGTFSTQLLADAIVDAIGASVIMKDAATVELVAPLNDPDNLVTDPTEFSNDPDEPQNSLVNNGVGWRAWSVPTQAQLNADAMVPNSSWRPYVGPYSAYSAPPISVVQDLASAYTLNSGQIIDRYKTSWGEWTELASTVTKKVALVAGSVTFTVPIGITLDRLSVYVNGVAQLNGTYTLVGTTVTVLNVSAGHQATLIVRAYSPTADELEFDPEVEDDLLIQRQYKTDYQYVEVPVRDRDGAITTTKYYFWVKNRTSAAPKNNLSAKAVAQLLAEGPSQYLTFQNISTTAPYSYNALAIAGLNYVVTKDNSFKLRFTRNFTLRDDPNQLDLKDTHVEWSLIRPGQRVKIPEALWEKMVNTACGQDPAGNALPSPRRASYDDRNGTRTRFGFGADQVLAPTDLVLSTLLFTILNTKLLDENGVVPIPDYMTFLDFSQSDTWFSTPTNTRNTLTRIWNEAKVSQINELFFAVLEDILASNYELADIFKTSRLSAYSIKVVRPGPIAPSYE